MVLQYSDLIYGVSLIVIILISLSVHEFAHAAVANLFGDPTAKLEGRLSLNPLKHWDSIGTTLLVVLLGFRALGLTGLPVFGWGKPVPVNEDNFDNPRLNGIQTALAGPMSNFILALLLAVILKFVDPGQIIGSIILTAIYLNIFLMFFNLLPIPPLDGSRLLRLFISDRAYYSIASNPLFLFGAIFLLIFVLADYIVIASTYLTSVIVGW